MIEKLFYTLTEGKLNDGKLYCIKKGTCLHLTCPAHLINRSVRVFCNLPPLLNRQTFKFERFVFYEYDWQYPSDHLKNDDFDKFIEINFEIDGTFQFYFVIDDVNGNTAIESANGGADVFVKPELQLADGTVVDLNCLQMQTVLTKLLGPLPEWQSRLRVTKESGYNMVHFTPVEELSKESNSSYSLRDHTRLNTDVSCNGKYTFSDLDVQIKELYEKWNIFSICDLVYNHMANDSPFLQTAPNAGYNLVNSAFLRPAFILDRVLAYLSRDIELGKYESVGIRASQFVESNLEQIRQLLLNELLPKRKFEEFYQVNVDEVLRQIKEVLLKRTSNGKRYKSVDLNELWSSLSVVQDDKYRRLQSSIDFDIVERILDLEVNESGLTDETTNSILNKFQSKLNDLNESKRQLVAGWLHEAVNNSILNAKYHFFDGPKYERVTRTATPFVPLYFYYPFDQSDSGANAETDEALIEQDDQAKHIQAHNGWVMNHDPLMNFCTSDCYVYMKRELIPWVDSVKLRYGNGPDDCPELWAYMSDYTSRIARTFHGVRLDNCHNTPLHVAEYFLDVARNVRPNFYVIAELFTNNEVTDNIFVSKLGIASLIRESMNSWNAQEFSRLLHRFGGDPAGSFIQPIERPLKESVSDAIFFDQTHDNPALIQRHTVHDALPRSALILMCACGYGSTRGYDELVPHEVNVVHEKRQYAKWTSAMPDGPASIGLANGIIRAKQALSKLHYDLGMNGYDEIYVDLLDDEIIAITRNNPRTHQSVVLIARTAFTAHRPHTSFNRFYVPLKFNKILFEAELVQNPDMPDYMFKKSDNYLNFLENFKLNFQENLTKDNLTSSYFISNIECKENETVLNFKNLPSGSVLAFSVGISESTIAPILRIRKRIGLFGGVDVAEQQALQAIVNRLTFDDLNIALYRGGHEEEDEDIFSSVYNVPDYGELVFCGLQGFVNILSKVRLYNQLGHPIFENLRQGNWMMEYIVRRLKSYAKDQPRRVALLDLANWLDNVFMALYQVPRYLIPSYFDFTIMALYNRLLDRALSLLSQTNKFVMNGSSFVHTLALGSVQLTGVVKSAKLPNTLVSSNISNNELMSLAAGLPHFSYGIWRNWGRDTFVSLRGLLLITTRFDDAKYLILTFASCLRHGLIPNLLSEGVNARYNARDAVWWWLKAIKDYTECAPNGHEILHEQVYRIYPRDDSPYPQSDSELRSEDRKQKLFDIIQEALDRHVNGFSFVERNAGPRIDEHMREEGFQVQIGVHLSTGFVYGGNRYNCGTWMDKMGSSAKANNKGLPSSPRDGCAVELVGLSRCVLDWLVQMNENGHYPYNGVKLNQEHMISQNLKTYTWREWAQRIDANFESHFWIDNSTVESEHINRREIYKDTLGSSIAWTDYQLRPNYLIALCVAPQMVNAENARKALENCRKHLFSQPNSLGIKTLDPSDFNYRGFYDNSDDSEDTHVAHGFNYHQGPEWLWPVGYYLRAQMLYSSNKEETVRYVQSCLAKYNDHIKSVDWKSLPELTNENGAECVFSCPSQAWSVATVLEACHTLAEFL